jgi:hypothetical protein
MTAFIFGVREEKEHSGGHGDDQVAVAFGHQDLIARSSAAITAASLPARSDDH